MFFIEILFKISRSILSTFSAFFEMLFSSPNNCTFLRKKNSEKKKKF